MTADEMLAQATVVADYARARQRFDFHERWGHFWKCPTCGMGFKWGHWCGQRFHCVPNPSMTKKDDVPKEYHLFFAGYAPPPTLDTLRLQRADTSSPIG